MSIRHSSRQVPANNTAPEGAPICGLSTSTTALFAASHDANESEQADELAVGIGVPATARSAEHVVGNQSDHGNPPDQTPQPCVDPSPSLFMAQNWPSSPPAQHWPRSFTTG